MSAAFVKEVVSKTGDAGTTVALTIPAAGVAAGNTLIIYSTGRDTTHKPTSITDSRGNTYAQDVFVVDGAVNVNALWSAHITTALLSGDTITITYPSLGNGNYCAVAAYEASGVLVPTLDKSATYSGAVGGATFGTTSTGVLTNGGDLYFVAIECGATDSTLSDTTTGLTALTDINPVSIRIHVRYKLLSGTAAVDYQGSQTTSSRSIGIVLGVYSGAGSAAAPLPNGQSAATFIATQ